MTPEGIPVHFYAGYHVTSDPDIVKFCSALKGISDVTGKIKLTDVPEAPRRTRERSWAAAASPTAITPAEILSKAVASSATIVQAAKSNG